MSRGATQIHHIAKAAQIKCRHHGRRTEKTVAVHSREEGELVRFRGKQMIENALSEAEFLLPAMLALANCILKMPPEPKAHAIRVENIAAQRLWTFNSQKSRCRREVVITSPVKPQ